MLALPSISGDNCFLLKKQIIVREISDVLDEQHDHVKGQNKQLYYGDLKALPYIAG